MDVIQKLLAGIGCLGLLWLGSCTMMGVGSAVVLQHATSPDALDRAEAAAEERETARHNRQMNDEAAYGVDREAEAMAE